MARTRYNFRQLVQLYIKNGGKRSLAPIMAAIALAESGGNVSARHVNTNGSVDQGLWQINSSNKSGQAIYDPDNNAREAILLAEHSGDKLRNWTTYKTGAYRKYLPLATKKRKLAVVHTPKAGVFTSANFAGTDQGVDYRGAGAIPALGSGVVTDVGKTSIIEGGMWHYMVYRLTSGPYKGHFVYVAENFVPTVGKGAKIKAGQMIGRALGTYPYIEVGFNRTAKGWNPSAALNHANPHATTPAGSAMLAYIEGMTGSGKKGGGGILSGITTGLTDATHVISNPYGTIPGLVGQGASAATGAVADATGIHPEAWVQEALAKAVDALAIAGGGIIFVLGFVLVAADIGLSSKAGKVAAAVPAGRYIVKSARAKTAASSARTQSASSDTREKERREEMHQARLQTERAKAKKTQAQATESRTRQKNRRRTKAEQEAAEKKQYYAGARDAASPTMAKIRKSKKR